MNRAEISRSTKEASEKWIDKFPKIAAMERDPRGLPIPANVSYDSKNGKPNFAITNPIKEIELFCAQKCGVTGTPFDTEDVWFITTPDLAFVPFGQLMDAPMCAEAKDFTLQVCPYFGMKNYERLSDMQARAMAPKLAADNSNTVYEMPTEFVAIKVKGFEAGLSQSGLRYLPSRHYARVEYWKERNRLSVIESEDVGAKIAAGLKKAMTILPHDQWPESATMSAKVSLDGSLNGRWPWAHCETKEHLLQEGKPPGAAV